MNLNDFSDATPPICYLLSIESQKCAIDIIIVMNEIIQKIIQKLKKYPDVKYKLGEQQVTVFSQDEAGFEVGFYIDTEEYTVSFDGWHDHFDSSEDALNCFVFGLSDKCRLKVYKRGNVKYKWEVEFIEKNDWRTDSTTGTFFFPFWKKREVIYLQNKLIKNS